MDPDIGKLVKLLSRAVSSKHVVEATFVSTITLQLYDWLLILPLEVEHIWRASWNWSKVLYLLTRYTPFATVAMALRNLLASNPTPESCKRIIQAVGWLAFIGLAFAEVILIVRTYAVWKRDRRVGIGLASLFILCQTAMGIITQKWLAAVHSRRNPHPEILRGCYCDNGTRLIYLHWVGLAIEEGVDLALMVVSAVNTHREYRSNLMRVVYRDGIRFYLYIFCVTLANVLLTMLLPVEFSGIGSTIEIVLHSILTCRLIIGIREASQSSQSNRSKSETFELSEVPCNSILVFAHRPWGENTLRDPEARAEPIGVSLVEEERLRLKSKVAIIHKIR